MFRVLGDSDLLFSLVNLQKNLVSVFECAVCFHVRTQCISKNFVFLSLVLHQAFGVLVLTGALSYKL
jgi:hypothetical protein